MTQANARLKVLRAEHAKKEAEDDAKVGHSLGHRTNRLGYKTMRGQGSLLHCLNGTPSGSTTPFR